MWGAPPLRGLGNGSGKSRCTPIVRRTPATNPGPGACVPGRWSLPTRQRRLRRPRGLAWLRSAAGTAGTRGEHGRRSGHGAQPFDGAQPFEGGRGRTREGGRGAERLRAGPLSGGGRGVVTGRHDHAQIVVHVVAEKAHGQRTSDGGGMIPTRFPARRSSSPEQIGQRLSAPRGRENVLGEPLARKFVKFFTRKSALLGAELRSGRGPGGRRASGRCRGGALGGGVRGSAGGGFSRSSSSSEQLTRY